MRNGFNNFIQQNSPDGGFLQSVEWRKFQESVGHNTFNIQSEDFSASIIEHKLPIAGKYFYIPHGPIYNLQFTIYNKLSIFNDQIKKIIELAKKNNIGWIRIDPIDSSILELIRSNWQVVKAPHDMQPREILMMDIAKSEEEILAEMKAKTRYNIKLAEKKGVIISNSPNPPAGEAGKILKSKFQNPNHIDEFIRLTKVMAKRQGISAHPENYYRKMLEVIPGDILRLYIAEYQGKAVAANIVITYGKTCTYLHGASDDSFRNVMAPYLLQWRQIQDARTAGCEKYDLGGISTNYESSMNVRIANKWQGITRFKMGFTPNVKPVEFPGSYDIVISPMKYNLYRIIQKIKSYAF
jgi:peptidoglycan pentaglycine glycine transferase (the first glycine)